MNFQFFQRIIPIAVLVFNLIVFSTAYAQDMPGGVEGAKVWITTTDQDKVVYDTITKEVTAWSDIISTLPNTSISVNFNGIYKENDGYNFNPIIDFNHDNPRDIGDYIQTEDAEILKAQTLFWVSKRERTVDHAVHTTSNFATYSNICNVTAPPGGDSTLVGGLGFTYALDEYRTRVPSLNRHFFGNDVWRANGLSVSHSDTISMELNIVTATGSNPTYIDRIWGGQHCQVDTKIADWNGPVGEFIAYPTALDATNRNKVESYLAIKWGITLDDTDNTQYVDSSGNEVYNYVTPTSNKYTKNIVGIAKDQRLDQKISKSINTDSVLILAKNKDFASSNLDPRRTSLNEGAFVVAGADSGDTSFNSDMGSHTNARMNRVWKVQTTGENVGEIYVAIANEVEFPTDGVPSLVLSSDETFDYLDTMIPLIDNGKHYYAKITSSGTQYLSFASMYYANVEFKADASGLESSSPTEGLPVIVVSGKVQNTSTVQILLNSSSTATNGADYASITSPITITIAPGDHDKKEFTANISITDDNIVEASQTIVFDSMTTSSPGLLVNRDVNGDNSVNLSHTYTIQDDDSATLSISPTASAIEGTNLTFEATLSGAVEGGFTLYYETQNGTATTADYTSKNDSITFEGSKDESKTIIVETTEDSVDENDETVLLNLKNIGGTRLTESVAIDAEANQGVGTIKNENSATRDTDQDNIPDSVEGKDKDSDDDGTPDYKESNILDSDGDNFPDHLDADSTGGTVVVVQEGGKWNTFHGNHNFIELAWVDTSSGESVPKNESTTVMAEYYSKDGKNLILTKVYTVYDQFHAPVNLDISEIITKEDYGLIKIKYAYRKDRKLLVHSDSKLLENIEVDGSSVTYDHQYSIKEFSGEPMNEKVICSTNAKQETQNPESQEHLQASWVNISSTRGTGKVELDIARHDAETGFSVRTATQKVTLSSTVNSGAKRDISGGHEEGPQRSEYIISPSSGSASYYACVNSFAYDGPKGQLVNKQKYALAENCVPVDKVTSSNKIIIPGMLKGGLSKRYVRVLNKSDNQKINIELKVKDGDNLKNLYHNQRYALSHRQEQYVSLDSLSVPNDKTVLAEIDSDSDDKHHHLRATVVSLDPQTKEPTAGDAIPSATTLSEHGAISSYNVYHGHTTSTTFCNDKADRDIEVKIHARGHKYSSEPSKTNDIVDSKSVFQDEITVLEGKCIEHKIPSSVKKQYGSLYINLSPSSQNNADLISLTVMTTRMLKNNRNSYDVIQGETITHRSE